VLLAEPDAAAIRDLIGHYEESWSSALIVIELRRLARREGLTEAADRMLASTRLHPITGPAIERASRLDPVQVRMLDAIHLDAAIDLPGAGTITTVLTHDEQPGMRVRITAFPSSSRIPNGPRRSRRRAIRSRRHPIIQHHRWTPEAEVWIPIASMATNQPRGAGR
jgi:hypothetical protein